MRKTTMTMQHLGKFLGIGLCASALVLTGCTKDTQDAGTENADNAENQDTDTGTSGAENSDEQMEGNGDGDGDPTGSFVPDNDIIDAATCDPWVQDCPEGEKCAAVNQGGDTWNSNKCVELKGMGQTGDECVYDGATLGTDDCDVGYICYYLDDENAGSCIPLCTGTPDDPICEGDANCSITNDGSLIKCLLDCDPLLQDCEPASTGCYWGGGYFSCYTTSGDIPLGEGCGYINDCNPGLICLDATVLADCQASACCASICDMSDPVCPTMGTECTAFYDEGTTPPGEEDVGICVVPGN